MAARDDVGGGGQAAPNTRVGANSNPGAAGPGTAAPILGASAQKVLTAAVLGSPAFPHQAHPYYAASPLGQHPGAPLMYPTPSPYHTNFSGTPTSMRRSSGSVRACLSDKPLRFLATTMSCATVALVLASAAVRDKTTLARTKPDGRSSLLNYSAFSYLLVIAITAAVYSATQLAKGIWEISFRCTLLPSGDRAAYATYIADTFMAWLLLSSSSVAAFGLLIKDKSSIYDKVGTSAWTLGTVSVVTSFIAFAAVAGSSILSGYKLCKRTIW